LLISAIVVKLPALREPVSVLDEANTCATNVGVIRADVRDILTKAHERHDIWN